LKINLVKVGRMRRERDPWGFGSNMSYVVVSTWVMASNLGFVIVNCEPRFSSIFKQYTVITVSWSHYLLESQPSLWKYMCIKYLLYRCNNFYRRKNDVLKYIITVVASWHSIIE
jgi:hypothetical protein